MAIKPPLRIGYAGTLKGYTPVPESRSLWQPLLNWLWTFQVQNLDTSTRSGYYLLQGLATLKEQSPEIAHQVLLHFWGNIYSLNQKQATQLGLANQVKIEGYKSKVETVSQLAQCDVLFLPLESGKGGQRPLFIPGKLYEYLKLGKPILAFTEPSDCTDILQRSGLGVICNPRDPNAIAETLKHLVMQKNRLSELYHADHAFVEKNFSFAVKTRELAKVFNEVLDHGNEQKEVEPREK